MYIVVWCVHIHIMTTKNSICDLYKIRFVSLFSVFTVF